jgi:phosphoribosylformylglycinamidine synthase
MEEALRNLACVGAPLDKVAVLDNFSWAKCTNPEVFGALVRACQACYDLAMYYGTPFVSGKDSLSNEFSWAGKTIRIPHTLLITALTVMPDAARAITMDVKKAGEQVIIIGETRDEMGGSEYHGLLDVKGGKVPRLDRKLSKPVLDAVASLTAAGLVTAAHDCSDGGLAVTLAEMAFAGGLGMQIDAAKIPRSAGFDRLDAVLFSESLSRIVVTVAAENLGKVQALLKHVPHAAIGAVTAKPELAVSGLGGGFATPNETLKRAWRSGLAGVG